MQNLADILATFLMAWGGASGFFQSFLRMLSIRPYFKLLVKHCVMGSQDPIPTFFTTVLDRICSEQDQNEP